jgi:tetratricopeptide (TPR) repeat protein/transglutaminase-like putative cysteine protease
MFRLLRGIVAAAILLLLLTGIGINTAAQSSDRETSSSDYATEPFVIEHITDRVQFEDDGTSNQDIAVRVKVQTALGVQQFGLLRCAYPSSTGTAEINPVQVIKPDGTVIDTPQEDVQDMPAQITQAAPFYSDIKEKQIAVKGLAIGDVLEYRTRVNIGKPLIAGQFWFAYNFFTDGIVLKEELQIRVPLHRDVKVKSPGFPPATNEEAGYRTYTWTKANLHRKAAEDDSKTEIKNEKSSADVQITSFGSWNEIADWYRQLQQPRAVPTAEIREKADELTRGLTSDAEKVRVLYQYAASNFRYIGVAFGIGRYQPHAAAEVLSNGYGDCKDKHTLLASLLQAVGIRSYPVLIHSTREIDPDIPSPGQFDHLITVVPQATGWLWLDTTAEVAPPGYLTANLRDKLALVIPDSGPAQLSRTPADPPFKMSYEFRIDGKLGGDGTLNANAQLIVRGDFEFLLRTAFRSTPQAQWKDLVQLLSRQLGFGGTVSDVTVSPPEAVGAPLQIRYAYERKKFGDWDNQRFPAPFPPINLRDLPQDAPNNHDPIKLESPGDYVLSAQIELPRGLAAELPHAVDIRQDFADYRASYSIESGTIKVDRRLVIHVGHIPRDRSKDYVSFRKKISEDQEQLISLNVPETEQKSAPVPSGPRTTGDYLRSLEGSRLVEQSRQAFLRNDVSGALESLNKAVEADPDSAEAWSLLGTLHVRQNAFDQGIGEMKKAIELAPRARIGYRTLAGSLMSRSRYDEALEVWRQLGKVYPDDAEAGRNTGAVLMRMGRMEEAVKVLEDAAKNNPDDAPLAFVLGRAYFQSGDSSKAIAAMRKAAERDSSSGMLNEVAYELADRNVDLDDGLRYAQQAVAAEEDETSGVDLQKLTTQDLLRVRSIGAEWDTLGWVQYRLGHFPEAKRYLAASWKLAQSPVIGEHLGTLYEAIGKTQQAAHFYALSLAAGGKTSGPRQRLEEILGNKARADAAVDAARPMLGQERSVELSKLAAGQATAEFFVLFKAGAGAVASKFISGSEQLRQAGAAITSAKYDAAFPDDRPTYLVRRGILDCGQNAKFCQFVLLPPESVYSPN